MATEIKARKPAVNLDGIVKRITKKKVSDTQKIIQLYCVTQLNYRGPIGDEAWKAIQGIIGIDGGNALAFIAGMMTANPPSDRYEAMLSDVK